MFAAACTKARQFIVPIVISVQTVDGRCASSVATGVLINKDGWVLTAAHVVREMNEVASAEQATKALLASQPQNRHERRSGKAKRPSRDDINRYSLYFGQDPAVIRGNAAIVVEPTDTAIFKLDNFDAGYVTEFPVFKDPDRAFEPGTSLCRYGFALANLSTEFDEASGAFRLHNFPMPVFPNEGILCRIAEIALIDEMSLPIHPDIRLAMFETSSPGIKGQSGGPIFDRNGTVWGIQSSTMSYPLEFNTAVEQFYHVGVGTHSATIIGMLRSHGIEHIVSEY